MTWWMIVLLCYFTFWLGGVNATVIERERYWTWMANSWEMLSQRSWWMSLAVQKDPEEVTLEDIAEMIPNLHRSLTDYHTVFSRPYSKEELMVKPEEVLVDE